MSKHYTVSWIIDVEADSPEEAAMIARDCQHPETEALHFLVMGEDEAITRVCLGRETPVKARTPIDLTPRMKRANPDY